jgi:hypothetical protein
MRLRGAAFVAILGLGVLGSARDARAADVTVAECLTASDASITLDNAHRLRAERKQLLVCANPACPAEVRTECTRRVEDVTAQIPTLLVDAKDSDGTELVDVTVRMDDETLTTKLDGVPLQIDPGSHTFTFERTGQPPVTRKLLIRAGEKNRSEPVSFGAPAPTPVAETRHGLGTQKIAALVAGGVGVVGLALGATFGVLAISQKSTAEGVCGGSSCPSMAGSNDWSTAATSGNVSTAMFIVGGIAAGGAAVLWFTAPKAIGGAGASTKVAFGPDGVKLVGTW